MKRRLSVAIAALGDKSVVFLDEPTTGMDPMNRKHVWSMIEKLKVNKAVVLTTHAMEEADALARRLINCRALLFKIYFERKIIWARLQSKM